MHRPTVKNGTITLQGPHCAKVSLGESTLRGMNLDASRYLDGGSKYFCVSDLSMSLIRRLASRHYSLQALVRSRVDRKQRKMVITGVYRVFEISMFTGLKSDANTKPEAPR